MVLKTEKVIQKFNKKGEKTSWSYLEISAEEAQLLNPNVLTSFDVKGWLDNVKINNKSLLPMGQGNFILSLNSDLRKKLNKTVGDVISINIRRDDVGYELDPDLMMALDAEQRSLHFFESLTGSHQKYFSKWIQSAKTIETKANRIAETILAMSNKLGYPEMIRARKKIKEY